MMMRPLVVFSGAVAVAAASHADNFNWAAITPTEDLRYHACYGVLKCARLQVPMDWRAAPGTDNRTVALAIAILPATVPEDDPRFGGTIVTNPGGPGGSGVGFVQRRGRQVQLGTSGNKEYEILSFDPRGIMFTTPRADCFGEELARDAMALLTRGAGGLDGSDESLRRRLAAARGFGAVCAESDRDEGILEHVSTAAVARDMVAIVDRVEELRVKTKKARRLDSGGDLSQRPLLAEVEEEHMKKKDVARIQYFGFSYGTILGNTFMVRLV